MITAVFTSGFDHTEVSGLWQYDYGQKLRIQGLSLPPAVEIQFSLNKSGGDSESRVGITKDGVTDVTIPDSMLENGGSVQNYYIYAFIYITDETSGKTVKLVQLHVNSRPKPEAFDSPEEKELFRDAIAAVNESAGKAETAQRVVEEAKEQVAKDKEEVLLAKNAVKESEKNVTENKEYVRQAVDNFTSLAENAVDAVNTAGQNQVNNIEEAGQAALDNISTGVDESLTQSGKAADAKKTGERIDELKSDIKKDYVTPQMFGGKGDGVTDDTIALQNTFNYAINNKVSVYIPSGTYLFDVLTFPLNQDGMIIKGCGKWKTKLKCISDTSQILFNDFLRYDISEICFEGKTTSTVPFIILNGVSHLSKFHDCIFRTNQGVFVHNSAYLSFYDCSFVVLGTNPCKYLLKINGEYFYARNCYFEGASSDLESYGVILSDCYEIYISNSDICNFFGGTGLQIKPESIGSYNIYVDNTTLVRCKTFIDLDCSYSINNINVNIDILDEAKSTKILTLHRDDGKTGILNGINGYINTRGSFNTNNELIIGDLYFGDNKIYVTNYTDNILKYGIYTPVVPVPVGINFPNRNFVLQGNKNIVRCGLLAVSPFYNHNLPSLKYTVVNGATPQKVEFYNTFGGGFGIQATYPESVTNPYTELIIRFVN